MQVEPTWEHSDLFTLLCFYSPGRWPFWQGFQFTDTKNTTVPSILELSEVSQLGTLWAKRYSHFFQFEAVVNSCGKSKPNTWLWNNLTHSASLFTARCKFPSSFMVKDATFHPYNLRNIHSTGSASFQLTLPLNCCVPHLKMRCFYFLQSSSADAG